MFRKSLIPLVFLLALAVLGAPLTAGADGNPSANGGGHATFGGDQSTRIKFSFSAVRLKDGSAVGNALLVFPADESGVELRVQADIDSLRFDIPDGLTTLSGIITKSNVPALEDEYLEIVVRDGAEDRIAVGFHPGTADIDSAGYTVEQGSIQVRPG